MSSAAERAYPFEAIAKSLSKCQIRDMRVGTGWLFDAHVAAEGSMGSIGAVVGALRRSLGITEAHTDAAQGAAELIYSDVVTNGARPRKDLKVLESVVAGLARPKLPAAANE